MGKYYTRNDKELFIFVTKNDQMIDLKIFPLELELFDHTNLGIMNEKIAIVKRATEKNIDKAEIILSLHGFKKKDYAKEKLEQYYNSGDESILENEHIQKMEAIPRETKTTYEENMEIIIPNAINPTTEYSSNSHTEKENDSKASSNIEVSSETGLESKKVDEERIPVPEDELIDSLIQWIRLQGIQIDKRHESSITSPQIVSEREFHVDDLLNDKNAQVNDITRSQVTFDSKTAFEVLLEQMNKDLKNRAKSTDDNAQRYFEKEHFPINEEIDRYIVEYIKNKIPLRNDLRSHEYQSWIEEELDKYILLFIKSKLPITNPNDVDNIKTSIDEIQSPRDNTHWSDNVKPAKIKKQEKFSPEIMNLLLELLKNGSQKS